MVVDLEALKGILTNKLSGGQITGGAAPVINGGVQQTASPEFVSNITGQQQPEFIEGLKQQANEAISQPVGYEARVQDALNNPVVPQSQPTQDMSGKLATLRDNLTTGMRNLATGFQDNYNNSLMQGDLMNGVSGENKGFAQKAGEALGTVGRVIQNPAVGGLIAALVAKKANPAGGWRNAGNVGLDMAKYLGNMRGNQNVLQSMGYKVPNAGIFSGVNDANVKSVIEDANNKSRLKIDQQKADQTYELGLKELEMRITDLQEKVRHNKATEAEQKELHRLTAQYHNAMVGIHAQDLAFKNSKFSYELQKQMKEEQDTAKFNSYFGEYLKELRGLDGIKDKKVKAAKMAEINAARDKLFELYPTQFTDAMGNYNKLFEE